MPPCIANDDRYAAITLNNIASLHAYQNDRGWRSRCFQEAAEQERRIVGDSHTDRAMTLNNIGFTMMLPDKFAIEKPLLALS